MLVMAVVWATLNWLLDAAALWVFVAAYGFRLGLDGLIVSFGLANVVAALPVTPGGLGLVEGVLVPTIVGFGAPRSVALLGVVSYRLVNFWMPIPAAGLAYLSLRAESLRLPESWRQLVRRSTEDAGSTEAGSIDEAGSLDEAGSIDEERSADGKRSTEQARSADGKRSTGQARSADSARSGDDASQHP